MEKFGQYSFRTRRVLGASKKIPPDKNKEKMKLKSTAVYNGTIFGSSK